MPEMVCYGIVWVLFLPFSMFLCRHFGALFSVSSLLRVISAGQCVACLSRFMRDNTDHRDDKGNRPSSRCNGKTPQKRGKAAKTSRKSLFRFLVHFVRNSTERFSTLGDEGVDSLSRARGGVL